MDKVSVTLTVLFEEPFWIGVFEVQLNDEVSVSKVIFGVEPKDCEVFEWIHHVYDRLDFSPAIFNVMKERKKNPKRRQRDINMQTSKLGVGTKSQQALKLQQEQRKTERWKLNKEKKQIEKQRKFDLKQQKRKEKHRGR